MTLQERQKREIERLSDLLQEIIQEREGNNAEQVEEDLNLVTSDPEQYFKNIDEEE